MYKLVRFLIERLSESAEGKDIKKNTGATTVMQEDNSKITSDYIPEKVDNQGTCLHDEEVISRLNNLMLKTEMAESSVTSPEDANLSDSDMHKKLEEHLEKEHELLKAAVEMAFDNQHPAEHYFLQPSEQVDARKHHVVQLQSQWDAPIKPLEEKRGSLEVALNATEPGVYKKLQKLYDIEMETESILSEIKRREDAFCKLVIDLEGQPKLASRRSYIEKIKEITKNSRKPDADINQILKETRELQLESNSIQERLHRTYAVVDETIFREAKKDPGVQKAYRLLTSIHEHFEKVSEKILATDRIRREVADHEAKLAAMASRSLNIDRLQADLDTVRRENDLLEQRLSNA